MPGRPLWRVLLALGLGGAILIGAGSVVWQRLRPAAPDRPGVSGIYLPSDGAMRIDADAVAVYRLSEREIEQAFKRAKSYLLDYRDNPAGVEINRLLLSNASAAVKERARALKSFLRPPNFATYRDPYAYIDGKRKVANLVLGTESIPFDLLVGYESERELEGTVPVTLDFAADLEDGAGLEVLGRVGADGGRFALAAVSLHRLVP